MKTIDLPDYAKKYKTKGFDVKKVGNEYYQYKVEHYRVKDKKYPVTKFIYIGKIDKEKGLIKAYTQKDDDVIAYLEYGLSNFIYKKYKRSLQRILFNVNGEHAERAIKLGIIKYIFGSISLIFLKSSFITFEEADLLFELYSSNNQFDIKSNKICNKIRELLSITFSNENDKNIVLASLRNMNVIVTKENRRINSVLSLEVKNIMKANGVKYE